VDWQRQFADEKSIPPDEALLQQTSSFGALTLLAGRQEWNLFRHSFLLGTSQT